eukprot:s3379_g16.t7
MLHSTYLDLFIHAGLLLVLDMGTLFTPPVDNRIAMVVCSVMTSFIVLAAIVLAASAVWQHFLVQRKPFHFFLCHHKKAAGSFARLLKIELLRRSSSFTSFIDVDDLSDLSKLFSYVSHDVEKLVLFGTPDVLKRTWCVGELVVARLHKVPTILLKLPSFSQPDEGFLLAYDSLVPDLGDFSSYGFGMKEVKDTLRWLGSVETISLPSYLSKQVLQHVVSSLTETPARSAASLRSSLQTFDNGCLVLADPENMEATATAYILAELTAREMMHTSVPVVLSAEDRVGPTKVDVLHLILVCTQGCLESSKIAEWLLQARFISTCFISPVISDDRFELPSKMSYQNLARHPYADTLDLGAYVRVLQAVFLEIALPFSPQSCSEAELRLRAKQISARLHPGAAVRNLSSRLVMLASNEELIEVSLALAADARSADSGSLGANISDADELELQRMVSSSFSDFTASCDAMPVESDTVEDNSFQNNSRGTNLSRFSRSGYFCDDPPLAFSTLASDMVASPGIQDPLDVAQLRQLEPRQTVQMLRSVTKKGLDEHALAFLDSLRAQECELNAFHYGVSISACAKNRLWQNALGFLNGMTSSLVERNMVHFNACMDVCAKSAQWQVAVALLGQVESCEVELSTVLFNSCINACDRGGQWQSAIQVLETMQSCLVDCDLITCNACLSALSKASEWQLAVTLLSAMSEETAPDTISYNACINACESGGLWQAALHLLESMKSRRIPTATRTLNGCIAACGGCMEWQMAFALMEEMLVTRLEYSAVTYMAATRACGGRWEHALSLLSDMTDRSLVDSLAYNSCISHLNGNWKIAQSLLESMEGLQLKANEATFTSLIHVYGEGLQWLRVCGILEEMSDRFKVSPGIACSAAISACEGSSAWPAALNVLQKLCTRSDMAPGSAEAAKVQTTANALCISACSKGRNWLVAFGLLQQALQTQLRISQATLDACIKAGEKDAQWQLSLKVLSSLVDAGVCDASAYFVTIGYCGRVNWQMAVHLLESASTSELQPDAFVCSAVITACERQRQWAQALQGFTDMRKWHLELNEMCCTATMSACLKSSRWESALHLYRLLEASVDQPGAVARCLLIDVFSAAGLWDGYEADAVGCSAVMRACERRGQWRQVLALWPHLQQLQWRGHMDSTDTEPFELHSVGPADVTAFLERALEHQWLLGYPLLPPGEDQLTHGLYKYMAGMQAMAARELLRLVVEQGSVLDPFCGSGTVLIEACIAGRSAIGCDLSPLASFVASQHVDVEDVDLAAFDATVMQVVRGISLSPDPWKQLQTNIIALGDSAVQRSLQFTYLVASQASEDDTYWQSSAKFQHAQLKKDQEAAPRFRGTARLVIARLRSLRARSFGRVEVIQQDCRDLRLAKPVHAIITSPPYPGVYDYLTTAESASLILGSRCKLTSEEKRLEIGRRTLWQKRSFEEFAASWQREQEQWLQAAWSLLLPGGTASLMIGNGDRDASEDGAFDNLRCTADAAEKVGFQVVATSTIASKRTSPSDRSRGRRRTEHMIHLLRPPEHGHAKQNAN